MGSQEWFYMRDGRESGPVSVEQLQSLLQRDELRLEDKVRQNTGEWLPLTDVDILGMQVAVEDLLLPEVLPPLEETFTETPGGGVSEDSSPSLILPSVLAAAPRKSLPTSSEKSPAPEAPQMESPSSRQRQAASVPDVAPASQKPENVYPPHVHRHPIDMVLRFLQKQFSQPMLLFLETVVVYIGHFAVLAGAVLMPIYCYYDSGFHEKLFSEAPRSDDFTSLGMLLACTLLLLVFQYITWRLVRDFKFWNAASPANLSGSSICDITSAFFFFLGVALLLAFTLNGLYHHEFILPFFGLCLCFGCMYIAFYALHPALSAVHFKEKNPPEEEIFGVCIFLAKLLFMRVSFMFYGLMSLIIVALATYDFFTPANFIQINFFAHLPMTPQFFSLCLLGTAVAPIVGCVFYMVTLYLLLTLRAIIGRNVDGTPANK